MSKEYIYISQLEKATSPLSNDLMVISRYNNDAQNTYSSYSIEYNKLKQNIFQYVSTDMTSFVDEELSTDVEKLSGQVMLLSAVVNTCISAIIALDTCRNSVRSRMFDIDDRLRVIESKYDARSYSRFQLTINQDGNEFSKKFKCNITGNSGKNVLTVDYGDGSQLDIIIIPEYSASQSIQHEYRTVGIYQFVIMGQATEINVGTEDFGANLITKASYGTYVNGKNTYIRNGSNLTTVKFNNTQPKSANFDGGFFNSDEMPKLDIIDFSDADKTIQFNNSKFSKFDPNYKIFVKAKLIEEWKSRNPNLKDHFYAV